jgi:hypothetical protein
MSTPAQRITDYLLADHHVIEELLGRARGETFELAAFTEMRRHLLRHIAIEEKVLFPAVLARDPGALPEGRQLKIEHAALASLLVPTPDLALAAEVATILAVHDEREESAGGVYERCEAALGDASFDLVERARAVPAVRASAYLDRPGLRRTAKEALEAAARVREP